MSCQAYDFLLRWSDAFVWWLPVAVILLVCYLYDKREGFIGKVLASKPLQWLGDISFEIFILQWLAALVFNYLIAPLLSHVIPGNMGINPYSLIPWFILPIDILLAWVVNRLFTRPISRLLK